MSLDSQKMSISKPPTIIPTWKTRNNQVYEVRFPSKGTIILLCPNQ